MESPYFESRITTTEDPNELSNGFDLKTDDGPVFFGIHDTTSTSGAQSSSMNEQDFPSRAPESYCSEISSACSGKTANLETCVESESNLLMNECISIIILS